jgi:hypothetical protein
MTPENAQVLALQALAWIASEDQVLPLFLAATGAGLADLRAQAAEPEFQGAVLDFLLQDDARVVAFCDGHGHPYSAPLSARLALPGGAETHWT